MVKFFSIIFCFLSLSTISLPQEVLVQASTDTTDYLIGDHIKYSLEIITKKNVSIINPFFRDSLKNVDVLNELPVTRDQKNDKAITKYQYVISRFDSSQVTIPQIKIQYRTNVDTTLKSVLSNSVTFNVHTLKVSVEEDIKDVKPPMRIPLDWITWILIIIAAIIVLAILYFIFKKYLKKKEKIIPKQKEIILTPDQAALIKLELLEHEKLWQSGLIKEYHSKITEIIREYFERRYNLPALELTTSESLSLLMRKKDAQSIIETTRSFLNNADMVKFAKFIPMDDVNLEMMKQAKEIVHKTAIRTTESSQKESVNV